MSSQGPYGRHGYATQGGGAYDGAQSGYAAGGGYGGGGYGGAAGGYGGGGYGGSAYSAAAPMAGYPPMQGQPPLQGGSSGYGSGDVGIGAASGYQVRAAYMFFLKRWILTMKSLTILIMVQTFKFSPTAMITNTRLERRVLH